VLDKPSIYQNGCHGMRLCCPARRAHPIFLRFGEAFRFVWGFREAGPSPLRYPKRVLSTCNLGECVAATSRAGRGRTVYLACQVNDEAHSLTGVPLPWVKGTSKAIDADLCRSQAGTSTSS
jgi:hypothetical protein